MDHGGQDPVRPVRPHQVADVVQLGQAVHLAEELAHEEVGVGVAAEAPRGDAAPDGVARVAQDGHAHRAVLVGEREAEQRGPAEEHGVDVAFGPGERLVDTAEFGQLGHRVVVPGNGLHAHQEAVEPLSGQGAHQLGHGTEMGVDGHRRGLGLLGQPTGAECGGTSLGQNAGRLVQQAAAHLGRVSLGG